MFLKLSFYICLPAALILKQPDLGTALIVLIMGFGILLIVGLRTRVWLPLFIALLVASPIAYHFLHDYQKNASQTSFLKNLITMSCNPLSL